MSDKVESFVSARHGKRVTFEDCRSCRLVNGALILGVGAYLGFSARKQKMALNRNLIYAIAFGELKSNDLSVVNNKIQRNLCF